MRAATRSTRCLILLAACGLALAVVRPAVACDICSVYTLLEARQTHLGVYAGLFEQYSDFSTLLQDGVEVDNEGDQYLHSSVTQIVLGYEVGRRLGLQANVPLVDRSFRRPEASGMETGSVSGLGDVSLAAHWRVLERYGVRGAFVWSLLGGVKLPTGDSARIGEELTEDDHDAEGGEEHEGEAHAGVAHGGGAHGGGAALSGLGVTTAAHQGHGTASGVHGHDLALGSGSVDALVGSDAFWTVRRFYTRARAQYALRQEGDFDYRYADDLTWSVEPGVFLQLSHDRTFSLGIQVTGEHKGEDRLAGERLDDTAIDAVYAGPALAFSHGSRAYAELEVDLPLTQDNSALQIVPDTRVRAALTWRF